jgi:hypothetical protein
LNGIEDFPENFDEFLDLQPDMPQVHWSSPGADEPSNLDQDITFGAPEPLFINTVVWPMHAQSNPAPFDKFPTNLLHALPCFQLKDFLSRNSE